ncbi:hypothetical protein GIB67_016614 [Kingdonia uniflora]|uniref:Uncharacterized protein n=1 Tax=Kingdonia uniflora TaxID=39325 RepID=A0A7J7MZR5_9MAGN|nr:hypothetical protein GIB67_016614 [Kingdonia uniflora]
MSSLHPQLVKNLQVLHALNKVCQPLKTIFITSDKDMKVALLAAERGIRTYGSDWLMKCVMRQELDLNAPQFAEPL